VSSPRPADILVVDDTLENHLVYATCLAELGENVITVACGEEALQKALEYDFAVILLDVNMPGMTGLEAARLIRLRRRSRHTPIIFVTAFADRAQTAEGYALGAVDYIQSPVVPDVMRAKVKVFVDLYRMRAEIAQSHALLEARVEERTAELAKTTAWLEVEVAERRRAEERMAVMVRELNHRVRNLLAVVQSITGRTLTGGRGLEEAREVLCSRLRALADAHDILTKACWSGASLGQIVEAELAAFTERVRASGPNVILSPSAVQTFALIVHELSTNAAKHGALSEAAGEVAVEWSITERGRAPILAFRWSEKGGPPVVAGASGFGLSLIQAMGRNLTTAPAIEFRPEGLVCEFRVPLDVISPKAGTGQDAGEPRPQTAAAHN
jgi:two-component sensor histidine kinase